MQSGIAPCPEHHAFGGGNHLRIVRDDYFIIGRDLAQGLFDRAQIAHSVIYDCYINHVEL